MEQDKKSMNQHNCLKNNGKDPGKSEWVNIHGKNG